MRFLWLAWKDIKHPHAGGAEVILHELAKRMAAEGHSVTILTALYDGALNQETIDGINIIRVGRNRYTHPIRALLYYLRHLRDKYDKVIETVNTAPYFAALFTSKEKRVLMYHQLARQIWLLETPFPISQIGYWLLEPIATWLLGKTSSKVVVVSNSTKKDLLRFGFNAKDIAIISEGIHLKPIEKLASITKYDAPTVLSLGAMREMKQTLDQIKAFEIAKKKMPNLRMKIAGNATSKYGQRVLTYLAKSPYKDSIDYLGHVSHDQKMELMRRSHCITVSSVKEGWGLIVTEAASQGTPAVVYDTDGLRDSVKHRTSGIITAPDPVSLSEGIVGLLSNTTTYDRIRHAAWDWSKRITFEQSYDDLMKAMG